MSIDQAASISLRNEAPSLTIALPGWLWKLVARVRASRQTAGDERIAEELPAYLRYDIGTLDCIPSRLSRGQGAASSEETLEVKWLRGV